MTFERAKDENRFDLIWNLSVNEGKSTEYHGITWQKSGADLMKLTAEDQLNLV